MTGGEIEALLQLAIIAVLQKAFHPQQPVLFRAGNPGLQLFLSFTPAPRNVLQGRMLGRLGGAQSTLEVQCMWLTSLLIDRRCGNHFAVAQLERRSHLLLVVRLRGSPESVVLGHIDAGFALELLEPSVRLVVQTEFSIALLSGQRPALVGQELFRAGQAQGVVSSIFLFQQSGIQLNVSSLCDESAMVGRFFRSLAEHLSSRSFGAGKKL